MGLLDIVIAGFDPLDIVIAGFDPLDIVIAGFDPLDIVIAGLTRKLYYKDPGAEPGMTKKCIGMIREESVMTRKLCWYDK